MSSQPSRNAPCPCGSGKKYKRCCGAVVRETPDNAHPRDEPDAFQTVITDVDKLSNRVLDLIKSRDWKEAEAVCRQLQERFPDQPDGVMRLAEVREAQGNRAEAARLYRETVTFMQTHEGFDEETIADMLESAKRLAT